MEERSLSVIIAALQLQGHPYFNQFGTRGQIRTDTPIRTFDFKSNMSTIPSLRYGWEYRIWTDDLLIPNEARYQATLIPNSWTF